MKIKMPNIPYNTICRYLFAAFIAVVFSSLLLLFGRSIVGTFIGVNENFYLKYYYDIINYPEAEKSSLTIPDSITIVNLEQYRSRHDIARILDKVYKLNPRIIGLDVFFKDNPDVKDSINEELISILKKVKSKIVLPCHYSSDESGLIKTIYPFFHEVEGLESLTYASTLAYDFYGYYRTNDSLMEDKDPSSPILPAMGFEIARQSKCAMKKCSGDFYINYSRKNLIQVVIDDTLDLDLRSSDIQDKIVLIGDMSDIKDMTLLPFRFGHKKEISGIEAIAYTIMSIKEYKPSSLNLHRFIGFTDWHPCCSQILSFIFTLLCCCLFMWYGRIKEMAMSKNKFFAAFIIILQPILFILAEVVIVLICYLITYFTSTIPDVFVCMVSIALVSISIELTNLIINKR